MRRSAILGVALALAGCGHAHADDGTRTKGGFPVADRPVAPIVSERWSTEPERDQRREATAVMAAAGVKPGMTVADIGAGEGYYTIRLSREVGPQGRVLAEDIVPAYHDALAARVYRERLDNVAVTLGKATNPGLPPRSFDRIFLVHMYHEIDGPYEFLWNLRPSLTAGGMVAVVDADRPTEHHGTPPALLDCEFRAVGYALASRKVMPQAGGYLALYQAAGDRPEPKAIEGCRS